MKKKKKIWIAVGIVFSIILIVFLAFFIYTGIYYHSTDYAISCVSSNETIEVTKHKNYLEFNPKEETKRAMIFYPGAKVEYTAYAPLCKELAEGGVLCILINMPFRMAVLDSDAAKKIFPKYDNIEKWYMAGHSLGGAMAANYTSKNAKKVEGLILLAAYSTEKIKDVSVLSIYGSEDKVLNMKAYKENKKNLPEDTKEVIIEGGCHCYFGYYGNQKNDGKPTITREVQQTKTKEEILEFILS